MSETTTCAIIGGGPAGMVLGLLLARAGVEVTVLEKHADFMRDFRGDTVHPTTLQLLDDLGLWPQFQAMPHSEIHHVSTDISPGCALTVADFDRLHLTHPYMAMVPQWDLLNLLAETAETEPTFTLRRRCEVTGLLRDGDTVTGVRYDSPDGPRELHAELTVACDGRRSIARAAAGLKTREFPVDFDVWWFRLLTAGDGEVTLFPRSAPRKAMVSFARSDYLQIAYLAPKGTDAQLRARGLDAFRRDVVELMPKVDEATAARSLTSLDDVKHLDVRLNRLHRWHTAGLLCIGDAAHAMSPVGGVGINLAIQDAVATARLLAGPLRSHHVTDRDLAGVRRRRLPPTVTTQGIQRILHRRVISPIMHGKAGGLPKPAMQILQRVPQLTALPAYLIGVGIRPEPTPAFARRTPANPR